MARQFYPALILLLAIGLPSHVADKPTETKPAQLSSLHQARAQSTGLAATHPGAKKLLAELEPQWPQLTDRLRNNLVKVADKYPKMKPDEQERVRRRITRWQALHAGAARSRERTQ